MGLRFRDGNGTRRRRGFESSGERRKRVVDNDGGDGEVVECVLRRPRRCRRQSRSCRRETSSELRFDGRRDEQQTFLLLANLSDGVGRFRALHISIAHRMTGRGVSVRASRRDNDEELTKSTFLPSTSDQLLQSPLPAHAPAYSSRCCISHP